MRIRRAGARSPDKGKGHPEQQSLLVWEVAESADSHFLSLGATKSSPGNRGERTHARGREFGPVGTLEYWQVHFLCRSPLPLTVS